MQRADPFRSGVRRVLVPPTVYNYDNVRAGSNEVRTLGRHIDVATLGEVTFAIRYTAGTFNAKGDGSVNVRVVCDAFTLEDPQNFLTAQIAAASITLVTPIPRLFLLNVPSGFGQMVQLNIQPIMGASGGPLNVFIAVEMIAKGGTDTGNGDDYNRLLGYLV